jgi:hypothetical protein
MPSLARVTGVLLFALLVAGGVTLVNGPWLRVAAVGSAGARFTAAAELDSLLAPYDGVPLLTVDTSALVERLRSLPAVADARVQAQLPDRLSVAITEKAPGFTWLTRANRLVVASDGTAIAALDRDAELPADLASLPAVDDDRSASRRIGVGNVIPGNELRSVGRLLAIDPQLIGSSTTGFSLRMDDEYGFILVSTKPGWQVALGFYQLDPEETEAVATARLDAQVAAVRTLFAAEPEAKVSWVDARNPGKVYWAP